MDKHIYGDDYEIKVHGVRGYFADSEPVDMVKHTDHLKELSKRDNLISDMAKRIIPDGAENKSLLQRASSLQKQSIDKT